MVMQEQIRYRIPKNLEAIILDNIVINVPSKSEYLVVDMLESKKTVYSYLFYSKNKSYGQIMINKAEYESLVDYCNSCFKIEVKYTNKIK